MRIGIGHASNHIIFNRPAQVEVRSRAGRDLRDAEFAFRRQLHSKHAIEPFGLRRRLETFGDREDGNVRHARAAFTFGVARNGLACRDVEEVGRGAGAVLARGCDERLALLHGGIGVVDDDRAAGAQMPVDEAALALVAIARVWPQILAYVRMSFGKKPLEEGGLPCAGQAYENDTFDHS